jgi:citrate lyase subunit alpha/citrate CoA-transferase
MKETVAMLNQQYVMPEGLAPYAGVTAKKPVAGQRKRKAAA